MKQLKPLFLKTYGKQKRRVSAWFPNENRNQVFDSSLSTDGDISMYEPSKETRERMTSVSSHRVARPAKRKALQCLIEKSLKEDMSSPSCLQPAQQRKTTSAMKTLRSNIKADRPLKRKPKLHVTETSSDEENIRRPRPPRPTQQRKATSRKKQIVCLPETSVRQKGHLISWISEREDSASTGKNNKDSVQLKTDSDSRLPSVDRFVTRRRRTVAAKSKLPRAIFNVINSSDDFTSGAFESRRILRPSRRRRIPPSYVVSSAENSANVQGTSSFANNTLREISLNGLADNSLGMSPRKPIFCSTPSAGPFGERPCLKPIPLTHTTDQSATPPSLSVSCVGVLSTFQEDLASPGLSDLPFSVAPPIEQGDSCLKAKTIRCGKEAKSQSEDTKHMNDGESPSINFFSTEDLESSSQFLSAAGESEWMIEALKEQCLTVHCTVQLERLYNLTVNQLCSQTNYSSCLGYSDIGYRYQTLEPSFNLHLSVSNNKTSCFLKSVNTDESSERAASVTNSNSLPPCSKEWTEQSTSELHVEHCQHTGSDDFIVDTQIQSKSPMQTVVAEEDVAAIKNTCLMKKCIVKLKTLSQLNAQQLKVSMQLKEGLTCNIKSENESRRNAITMKDLTCPGENTETTMVSIGQPKQNSSRAAEIQSYDTEMEGELVALTTMLKEKCLTDELTIRTRRLTLSQLKEIQRLRDRNLKSQSEVSDSYTDGQIKNHHQSESDNNHSNEDSCATGVFLTKTGSSSSKEGISSDQEETYSNLHKRKKTSLVPKDKKRRSISTDRPGTTRKANVSGLSVNRWKNKDAASTHVFRSKTLRTGSSSTVDCSISEMISKKQEQPREVSGTTMNFITPLRASRLNLSSFLANLTPNTHTWSRLKAALSVHRKGMVQRTPRSPRLRDTPRKAALIDVSQDLFASPFRASLPKRLRSQLLEHNSSGECEAADLSDAEKVYAECGQQHPLLWEECILPQRMKQCVKIGEGTFGEVFSMTNTSGEAVALKIIPVEGSEQVNGEDQKTFGEILHEIIISKELSRLKEKQQNQTHGFIGLNNLHCVQGCYPPDFLDAWDTFDQKKGSENDRPDFFEKDQVFIILEFEFGGIDLENSNGTLSSLGAAKSILHQVTAALAVAEQELHFEHRDLHWGNVLVKPTKQKKGSFLLNGAVHSLETKGVLVRIIDYSLSRLEIDDLTVSCDIANDEELFTGQGDYQFDIYRIMRQENGNNWSNYHPHTNVLWLHYLCSKLLSMKYRSSRGKGVREMKEALTRFHDNVLQYRSATEVLQNCLMFQ